MSEFENATPRPWRAEGPDMFGDYNIQGPVDALAIGAVVSNMRLMAEARANAELIVRAVNAFEPLVEAVEQDAELFRQLAEWAQDHEMPGDSEGYLFRAETLELAANHARGKQ